MVSTHKTDRDQKLPSVVHAYNTSKKRTTGKNPSFLVFGQGAIHGVELEVETLRVMAYRGGIQTKNLGFRRMAIQDLEETRREALKQTIPVQAEKKGKFDAKLPWSHGIQKDGLILLYDDRRKKIPGKLHTRWMGPYQVVELFKNGSLQLEDLQGNWLETRVNGSKVKKYGLHDSTEKEGDTRSDGELPGIAKTG